MGMKSILKMKKSLSIFSLELSECMGILIYLNITKIAVRLELFTRKNGERFYDLCFPIDVYDKKIELVKEPWVVPRC